MREKLELWYPNYQNNPGILSKIIRETIEKKYKNFNIEILESYFEGYERYILDLTYGNPDYRDYISNELCSAYGKFTQFKDLKADHKFLGRLISPGKVGFGIFVDIGLRIDGRIQDSLLPLFQIREDMALPNMALRQIVKKLGMITGFPIQVEIAEILENERMSLRLSATTIERYLRWLDGSDKLIITKTFGFEVEDAIKQLKYDRYIDHVEEIDPLTTVVHCLSKTKGTGLIPRLGSRLIKSPIGLLHSSN